MASNEQGSTERPIPSSILIIGSGVFGLSTAYSLCNNPSFKDTSITLVDRHPFPAPDGASIDCSRIVRADYADPAYAALAASAQTLWRGAWGADNRYHESGLVLTASPGREAYVAASLANVQDLTATSATPASTPSSGIEVLPTPAAIQRAAGVDPASEAASGTTGYFNAAAGWADAEACMRWLRSQAEALNRVRFETGTVTRLLYTDSNGNANPRVAGAQLSDARTLTAELTVLAAGAWTPSLLDTRGILTATGQVLCYVPLSAAEQDRLGALPALLNMSTGMFVIPPANRVLKVARHAHGYLNPVRVPYPEPLAASASCSPSASASASADTTTTTSARTPTITTSLPATALSNPPTTTVPPEGQAACRAFLAALHPSLATRPWSHTRICWYADTPRGDFLIDHHPKYAGLFVATGGSGHAFKFLPVIGAKVVECIVGRLPEELRRKWGWSGERVEEGTWVGDGSRAGRRGMVLREEMGKGGGKSRL
ncbi:sarcosine oxidase [Cenococcum geophilum 1.58]|uniref:Sarcosine oxidase n=1 Tax=Cenococcum geophilum 1.58 TaxID=794803 RepID=A0ACC8EPZ7_9PEZI|nr:sarcosine oxidase [Cenococcum geophilum 1.58]